MNAMEKVAWTEVIVSGVACLLVAVLYPWLGQGATGGFGILGFLAVGMVFMRKRGEDVITDERDREIARDATNRSIHLTWMAMVMALAVITIRFGGQDHDVPVRYLVWLVWLNFAITYLVKGLLAIRAYRGDRHAAQG